MNHPIFSLVFTVVFVGLVGIAFARGNELLKVGDKAPDFTAKTIDGKDLTLSKIITEKPVVLVFIRGFG